MVIGTASSVGGTEAARGATGYLPILPALPIDKIEPLLPMLRIEPALPMLKIEPALPILKMEPALPMQTSESALNKLAKLNML